MVSHAVVLQRNEKPSAKIIPMADGSVDLMVWHYVIPEKKGQIGKVGTFR
ncbi:hypothetical protein Gotur_005716 [Gossypium turneri]